MIFEVVNPWSITIFGQVILFGIALSMDAFAVSVTDGLIYKDINLKKIFAIAITFGVLQGLMPLLGYWLVEAVDVVVGQTGGEKAGKIMALVVSWVSFSLLLFIGGKMLIESLINIKKPSEKKEYKNYSYKEVLLMGIATSIDALATGVAFHSGNVSTNITVFPHCAIIIACTFIISLIGLLLGKQINKILKGKFEITQIAGGIILIGLAIWVVVS